MAESVGIYFASDHTRGRGKHLVLRSRHCEPRAAHGDHLGFKPHRAYAQGSLKAVGGFHAVHHYGSGGRSARACHELVHAATGRQQGRGRATDADLPWPLGEWKITSWQPSTYAVGGPFS